MYDRRTDFSWNRHRRRPVLFFCRIVNEACPVPNPKMGSTTPEELGAESYPSFDNVTTTMEDAEC